MSLSSAFTLLFLLPLMSNSFPEQGKWKIHMGSENNTWAISKSLFENSTIRVRISCSTVAVAEALNVSITWVLRETKCWDEYSQLEYLAFPDRAMVWDKYLEDPNLQPSILDYPLARRMSPPPYTHRCDGSISLPEYRVDSAAGTANNSDLIRVPSSSDDSYAVYHEANPVITIPNDGIYLLIIRIIPNDPFDFQADVSVEMKSLHGYYLSAADWPLLQFYGGMCALYVAFGLVWLVLCFLRWRDLLKIQFWIGGVIFLGMLEMAVFYAEYQNINSTGVSVAGAVLFAEVVSCAKRSLARLLIIIVSIGFGIVKPRLGTTLHKLILLGGGYFILASSEACLRVFHPVNGPSSRAMMAGIGLSILDGIICYCIFQSLLATTRTLRLRRNLVKLALYRNFATTLIFSVMSSVGFMVWSLKVIKTPECLQNWKQIWVDEAYWHLQFCLILTAILILFRPTNNNQRYAFTPLFDDPDDEEEDLVINEAFTSNIKLRPKQTVSEKTKKYRHQNVEEDLKWVDGNIPIDYGEGDLPAMDSEEELIASKFELSKMQ